MPEREIQAVWGYLQGLEAEGIRNRIIDIEHKWRLELHPDLKPLTGTVDLIVHLDDGTIVLIDHKTSRGFEDEGHWSMQAQPLLYSLWARRAFPGRKVRFRIGYCLLNKQVEWETDPAVDDQLLVRFVEVQEEMRVYHRTGRWLETPGEACKWCALKKTCGAFQAQLKMAQETELASLGGIAALEGETEIETFVRLQRVSKHAGDLADEVKASLLARVGTEVGAQLEEGGHVATVTVSRRRQAAFSKVGPVVQAMVDAGGDIDVDDLYTVSVTKLDALLQSVGAEGLAEKMMTSVAGNPSLKVTANKLDLGGKAPRRTRATK